MLRMTKWVAAIIFVFLTYIFLAGSVDKSLSATDITAIQKLQVSDVCDYTPSFADEIACIKAVQNSIRSLVTSSECAANGTTIEPESFIQRGYGCCFDRARFTEKALAHFGFETRHVAIYDRDAHGVFGLLVPQIDSHATTEVKTKKGWMGVDSNEPFMLLTKEGEVLTYKNFKDSAGYLMYPVMPEEFYNNNLLVIYGLFSRHGMFHGRNLPTPEFNLRELLHNFDDNRSGDPVVH